MTLVMETPEKGIAQLRLDREAKRNALDGDLVAEWLTKLEEVIKQKDIQVLLITAAGKDFCAGADVSWMQKMATRGEVLNRGDALQLATLFYRLYTLPIPVIAMVQGATRGGGMGIVCTADMVIASEEATFGFPEARVGLAPSVISPFAVSALGERRARYYFMTGEIFSAQTAESMGLVQKVVPADSREKTGLEMAKKILQMSPNAVAETRKIFAKVSKLPISEELMQVTADHLAGVRKSQDATEGLKAFLEKRQPVWTERQT